MPRDLLEAAADDTKVECDVVSHLVVVVKVAVVPSVVVDVVAVVANAVVVVEVEAVSDVDYPKHNIV